jgi:adenylate cyclase
MTQADEASALRLLDEQARIVRPLLELHHGRQVKSMGDGLLLEFPDALDAVECAADLQRHFRGRNARERTRPLQIRIGIHLGDVQDIDGDLVGDTVNVASRIEPLAEPGGICVTEPVYSQVRTKIPHRFEGLGARTLKGVERPIEVYRLLPGSDEADSVEDRSTQARRLAVLPFVNMSPDPQDEYFADGLTEEIITELSRLPDLQVIARTSVMRFKGTSKGVKEVGRELSVPLVLEGSVRKSGARLRITIQLIDAATEAHLLAERFDRELTDIFAVQSEIASSVGERLGVVLARPTVPNQPPSGDVEAYFLYLRGRHLWNRRNSAAVRQALQLFERAVAIDPKFAAAHSGIADCWAILSHNLEEISKLESGPKIQTAAREAIRLQSGLAEAHASLGLALLHDYVWAESERELRTALELNPNYVPAHNWYSILLGSEGRVAEARAQIQRAGQLDPLSPVVQLNLGFDEAIAGDLLEADRHWDSAIEIEPAFREFILFYRVAFRCGVGELERARQAFVGFEEAWEDASGKLEQDHGWVPATVLALLGRREQALRSLDRLTRLGTREYVPSHGFAYIYAALGDADRFFEWMARAIEDHSADAGFLRTIPLFKPYHSDPRFAEIWARLGLPETAPPT